MKIDLSKRGAHHDDSDGFFITKPREIINNDSSIMKDMEDNKIQDIQEMNNNNEDTTYRNNTEHQGKKKRVLIISNFQVVKNEEYFLFYNENSDIWGQINYLLEHLGKIFKKLNLTLIEVYEDKILELAKDETRIIQNKDLLMCISEKDLMDKGLDPNDITNLYTTLKEKFALKIQMAYRIFKSRLRLKEMQSYFDKIKLIQHVFTSLKLIKNAKDRARVLFDERYKEWIQMQNNFQKKWEIIKNRPHIEIHFNSISLNSSNSKYMNTTFDHFSERENNQLNRIVNLFDSMLKLYT
jgi:hypothetical protein